MTNKKKPEHKSVKYLVFLGLVGGLLHLAEVLYNLIF